MCSALLVAPCGIGEQCEGLARQGSLRGDLERDARTQAIANILIAVDMFMPTAPQKFSKFFLSSASMRMLMLVCAM